MRVRLLLVMLALSLVAAVRVVPQAAIALDNDAQLATDAANADKSMINQDQTQIDILKKERKADLDVADSSQKKQLNTLYRSDAERTQSKEASMQRRTVQQETNLARIRIKNLESEIDRNRSFLKTLYDKRREDERKLIDVSRSMGINEAKLKELRQGIKRIDVTDLLLSDVGTGNDAVDKKKFETELATTIGEQKETVKAIRAAIVADREREISQEKKIELLLQQLSEAKIRLNTLESDSKADNIRATQLREQAQSDGKLAIQQQATVSKDINAAEALRAQEVELQQKRAELKRDEAEKEIEANRDRKLASKVEAKDEQEKMKRRVERQKEQTQEDRAMQREIDLDKKIAAASVN